MEYAETNFSVQGDNGEEVEDMTHAGETVFLDEASSQQSQDSRDSPPSLPISPPPGPTLLPRFSIVISDGKSLPDNVLKSTSLTSANVLSGLSLQTEGVSNRYSVVSLLDDAPPPLPSSLPPGKLISPRHSVLDPVVSYDSSGNIILTYASTIESVDMDQLSKQISSIVKERERELQETETLEESGMQMQAVQNRKEVTSVVSDTSTILGDQVNNISIDELASDTRTKHQGESSFPPHPTSDDSDSDEEVEPVENGSMPYQCRKLNPVPSFLLRTFDPPAEYTDSGFPDSDQEVPSRLKARGRSLSEPPGEFCSRREPVYLPPMHQEGGFTGASDAEYTESVGMKTSSGSVVSTVTR